MRFSVFPILSVLALALGLSACVSRPPMISKTSFVDKVDVELQPGVASQEFASSLRSKVRTEATRYAHSGEPKTIRVQVSSLNYKNPALALLVGDSNNAAAQVTVIDSRSGQSHGTFGATAIDTYAVNGIAGAVIAAAQNRSEVDSRLAQALAADVLEQVYGTEATKEARQRPTVPIMEAPAAAPAAPAKPLPAPAKSREPKTAMLEAAPATR